MQTRSPHEQTMPLGVVVRRLPGVTRWAKWSWRAVAVLPGAPKAQWKVLREEGDSVEYHAATLPLTLYRTEAEAYLQGLSAAVPAIYVVMRPATEGPHPLDMVRVTASPFEAQYYASTGEEIVEKVPMPAGLMAWVEAYVAQHYEQETFVKRQRDRQRIDRIEDGVGDARIAQMTDVYRAPGTKKAVPQ